MLWVECSDVDPTPHVVMRYKDTEQHKALQCVLQMQFGTATAQFIYGLIKDIPPAASKCFIHVHCEGAAEHIILLQKEPRSATAPQTPARRTKDDRRPSGISFA